MNMRASKILLSLSLMLLFACRPDDRYLYEVNTVDVLASNDHKSRQKSEDQYLATLYTNLYQQSISGNKLAEMREVIASLGDKDLGKQMLTSKLLNDPEAVIPTNIEMRADLDGFIQDTYRRFLVREPSIAELTYLKNILIKNPQLTPDMIYLSFTLSKEYQFY
ncbi:MAG: hypothetical protein AB8H47_19815 [Bacteroidia bacterium]